jgi:MFS family permease
MHIWTYRAFRIYLGIRFFFTFAAQMQTVALGFYVYETTRSTLALGLLGLCEAIPAIGIALYGGYITDKSEKRQVLILVHTAVLATSVTLLAVSGFSHTQMLLVYALLFCNGTARAFYEPASFTVYAHSIPKTLFARATSWSSASMQLASILGPAAGGFAYAGWGMTGAFGAIVLVLSVSTVLVCLLPSYPPVPGNRANIWESITEGLGFVFRNKMMLYAMSLDLFCVLFGGVAALLPVFADRVFKVGPQGLGIMRAALASGAVLCMLAMTRYSPVGKPWRNLLVAVAGFGVAIICFGLTRNYYLALACLFLQGVFDSVSMLIRGTIMQHLIPEDMRGRVSAINSMFISSSAEIGDFESGVAASIMGSIPAVIFGGCMTLLIVGFTWARTRSFLRFTPA